ncbi:hypothetical protein WJX72_010872 [[Myrmecia] bisecta]|uniref:G-patch domain-containing protein n=1 Tax=[Myrmecia] bisecta TaxID=41462 RepID=A0AAW1PDF2_9CHLO
MADQGYEVYDPRLQAGRGEEFSASRLREKEQQGWFEDDDFRMPMSHRVEDSLDDSSFQRSADTALDESNVGYQMLQRMGWNAGKGLGRKEDGIVEPVKGGVEAGIRLGLGKAEEDTWFTAAENVQRKRLEVEVQADEDEERTRRREIQTERDQKISAEVSEAKRKFYCETCHKQYSSAMEMETHLSSYDHHHKKRLKEMQAMTSERTRKERGKKERRRAEKEAAKLQAQIQRAHQASGLPPGPPADAPPPPPSPPADEPPPPPPPPEQPAHSHSYKADPDGAFGGWSEAAPPNAPAGDGEAAPLPTAAVPTVPAATSADEAYDPFEQAPESKSHIAAASNHSMQTAISTKTAAAGATFYPAGSGFGTSSGAAATSFGKPAAKAPALSFGGARLGGLKAKGSKLKPVAAAFQMDSDDDES